MFHRYGAEPVSGDSGSRAVTWRSKSARYLQVCPRTHAVPGAEEARCALWASVACGAVTVTVGARFVTVTVLSTPAGGFTPSDTSKWIVNARPSGRVNWFPVV